MSMARKKSGGFFRKIFILAVLGGLVFLGLAAFRAGPPPIVRIAGNLPGIGKSTTVTVVAEENVRGLSGLRVEFVQGERVELLEERSYTALEPWQFWGPRTERDQLTVEVGSQTLDGLQEGPAAIRVVADRAKSWLRRPDPTVLGLDLPVKLRPPALQISSIHTYVTQGGCEVVVYRTDATSVVDGVQAGNWWFPGHPLPGGDELDRFALFAAPYDIDDPAQIRLLARDNVNNEAQASFLDRFNPKPYSTDTIRISDGFMSKVVPAILGQTPALKDQGNLLDNYLMINRDLRTENAKTLIALNASTVPEFLWDREFLQMRNAQVRSKFADRRTYVYEGRDIDQQDHLGFDLASTARAEIQAANNGVVVLARYFGIYGNAVVIDHGYGLMSLYGHLSSISVEEGQEVSRADVVGRSGETGLAGGDHLHFTMMLQGLPVNPREWWDGHWIHDRLKLKLGDAMPFDE